jgi:hypothetical protein
MAKVITFSRRFPAQHAKKGQQTHFVEKFLGSIGLECLDNKMFADCEKIVCGSELGLLPEMIELHEPKHHTIRKGNRFKSGDIFSPRIWSESPYHSPQIKIGPDTLIAKTWNIRINLQADLITINGIVAKNTAEMVGKLSGNDGLTVEEFREWFKKPFDGQIICWNPEIEY